MRSHRALNRDIAERGLDPRQPYASSAIGGDGRLSPVDEEAAAEQLQAVVEEAAKLVTESDPSASAEVEEVSAQPVVSFVTTGAATITVPSFEAPKPAAPDSAPQPVVQEEVAPKKRRGKEKAEKA